MMQRFLNFFKSPAPAEPFDPGLRLQQYSRALIATPLDTDQTASLLVSQISDTMASQPALVFLKPPGQREFTVQQPAQTIAPSIEIKFELDDALPRWLADHNKILPLAVPKEKFPLTIAAEELARLQMLNIHLCVPLPGTDQLLGWVALGPKENGQPYTDQEQTFLTTLAHHTAIALEKSQLLHETKRRADQLTTLMEVSAAITATLKLDDALQQVMNRAVEILNAEAGSLLLMDRQGKELSFEVVLGPTGAELQGVTTPVGTGIVGTVAKTGQPLIINNVAADPRWNVAFDEATDFQTRDILCVPMITHDQVVGVIELINKKDGLTFTEDEQELLLAFAAQSAIAIENAQQFTRTDQALAGRVQELQALQMFDKELQTSLELRRVLDILLTHAMDALGLSMGIAGIMTTEPEPGLYLLAQRGMPTEMGRYRIDPWPLSKGVMGRAARTGEPCWANDLSQEKDYIPKNHRTRSVLVIPVLRESEVIAVLDLESPEPDYFTSDDIAFVRVLTNHAAIAIENAQLFEKARVANEAKSEFMSTASHELKIPMTSIKGYAKILQMGAGGDLSEQQKEFLGIITNNVDRMTQLVNDLLDVSRIETGRIRLEISDVDIAEVIDEVLASVQTQIESRQLKLTVDINNNLPELRADRTRLVQIMTNLVSNAYKYTPEGGQITVTARPHQNEAIDGVAVTVADTGFGISEEDQVQLFKTFFRSSDDNIREQPGTGLGLAITKKMVESHGGELTFATEHGHGSTFSFILPRINIIPPGVEVVER